MHHLTALYLALSERAKKATELKGEQWSLRPCLTTFFISVKKNISVARTIGRSIAPARLSYLGNAIFLIGNASV